MLVVSHHSIPLPAFGNSSSAQSNQSFQPGRPVVLDKDMMTLSKNMAASNYANLQALIAIRLRQLSANPSALSMLPMGELRQLSQAIVQNQHDFEEPPPPGMAPPPPPPRFTASA